MRNLKDVCKAFQFKQWWIFRTKQTLWGDFLKAKYCQRSNPVSKKGDTRDILTWKNMLMNRPQVEQHIQWKIQAGNCSFGWDNWLGSGPLAHLTSGDNRLNNSKVADFWEEGRWSLSKLLEQAPASHLSNILATVFSPLQQLPDHAVWKPNTHGGFSCSSALEEIREKRAKNHFNSLLWHKNIPFKSSFLLWRALRGKLPTNDRITNLGIQPAACVCCFDRSGMDSIDHILGSGKFAAAV